MQQAILTEIVLKVKQGDTKAFRLLVEAHQKMVFTLAFRLLCNEEEAKDIVQETFIRIWKHIDRYNVDMKFTTWMFTITSNLCYDRLKAIKRKSVFQIYDKNNEQKLKISSVENLETNLINRDLAKIITALTNKLSPKQKLVFILRDIEGIEIEEIISITGLTSEKIKSNIFLARKFIREKLDNI